MGESLVCVAALIFDTDDRLFLVRRAADLALFANCWDVVGGHVEPGESVAAALRREVYERPPGGSVPSSTNCRRGPGPATTG